MKKNKNIKSNWHEIKENLKIKFAKLTDNDLLFEENKKNEMFSRLQKKLRLSKQEIRKIISDL